MKIEDGFIKAIDNALNLTGMYADIDGKMIKLDDSDIEISRAAAEYFNTDMVLFTLVKMIKDGNAVININMECKDGEYLKKLLDD